MEPISRHALITRNLDEVITDDDLNSLLSTNEPLNHYIGFEISGKVHLGTGILAMQKVRDFAKAGIKTHIVIEEMFCIMVKCQIQILPSTSSKVLAKRLSPKMNLLSF